MAQDRRAHLEQSLEQQYKILNELDEKIITPSGTMERAAAERERAQVRENIRQLQIELDQLPPPAPTEYFRANYLTLSSADREGPLFGREKDLADLNKLLAQGGAAIVGVGGQGKTALAYHSLKPYLNGTGRFEAIVWQTVQGDGTDLNEIAAKLGVRAVSNPQETTARVLSFMAAHPVIVVLDNLESALNAENQLPLDLQALFRQLDGRIGQSQALITTREMPENCRLKPLRLSGLGREAGADLLAERGLSAEPRARLLEAATKAAGHPFALRLLAELATDAFMPESLENLLAQRSLWDEKLAENLLRKVWDNRLNPVERELLQILAVLRPPVRRATLNALAPALPPAQRDQILRGLAYKALLSTERPDGLPEITYDLHPLLRRFILDEKLDVEEQEKLHRAAAAYFQNLLSALPSRENYGRKLSDVWPILEAIYHLNQMGDFDAASDLFYEEELHEDLDRWGQAGLLAQIYEEWADPAFQSRWRNSRPPDSILGNLGIAYKNLGQVEEAIKYHQQALTISREIGDRRGEGNRLGNLGIAYKNLGQVEEAIKYHQQALAIAREIGDRSVEGSHLGNLGIAYRNLGQVEEAIKYHQQALAIAREIGDRRNEGSWLGNLGAAYEERGELDRALAHWRRSAEIFREIKSPNADLVQGWIDELQENEGEEAFARLWAESEAEYQRLKSEVRSQKSEG